MGRAGRTVISLKPSWCPTLVTEPATLLARPAPNTSSSIEYQTPVRVTAALINPKGVAQSAASVRRTACTARTR